MMNGDLVVHDILPAPAVTIAPSRRHKVKVCRQAARKAADVAAKVARTAGQKLWTIKTALEKDQQSGAGTMSKAEAGAHLAAAEAALDAVKQAAGVARSAVEEIGIRGISEPAAEAAATAATAALESAKARSSDLSRLSRQVQKALKPDAK